MTDQSLNQTRSLSDRDRRILEHVARHRLTIYQVLHRLFFAGQGLNAVVKVAGRLCRTGYLQKIPILRRRHCFVLSPMAARVLGVSIKRTGSPGAQALPTEFAVLLFAARGNHSRQRLTISELRTSYPWMSRALISAPHCLDQSQPNAACLELIRIDLGGKVDHVARKCELDIRRRRDLPDFIALLRRGQFRLVVITATPEKARAIREALDRQAWPDGLEIRLVVLPQLLSLLGGSRDAS